MVLQNISDSAFVHVKILHLAFDTEFWSCEIISVSAFGYVKIYQIQPVNLQLSF